MKTERGNIGQLINNYFSVENTNPILSAIVLLVILIGLISSKIAGNKFHSSCKKPLEQAAASSSISIAIKQLAVIKAGCQPYLNSSQEQNSGREI